MRLNYAHACGTIRSRTPNLNICQVIEAFQQGVSLQRGAIKANLIRCHQGQLNQCKCMHATTTSTSQQQQQRNNNNNSTLYQQTEVLNVASTLAIGLQLNQ